MRAVTSRFPPKQEILKLFWVALAVSNLLAFLGFAYVAGELVLRFSPAKLIFTLAYVLSYALLEGIFVLFLMLMLGFILPAGWLQDNFSQNGTALYLLGTFLLYPWFGFTSVKGLNDFYILANIIPQNKIFITLWLALVALVTYLVIRLLKNETHRQRFHSLIDRLSTLSMLYFILDIVSIIVVIFRLVL